MMDETACRAGALSQLVRDDIQGSKPEPDADADAEQNEHPKNHTTNSEGRWGKYAASINMSGFGALSVPSASQPDHQHQKEDGSHSLSLLGDSKSIVSTQPPSGVVGGFGQASPLRHGFDKLVWEPPITAVALTKERSLEDLYKDYPEKQLKGIDESDLDLAARVILQVTNEATMQWITRWCPGMAWSKLIEAAKPAARTVELSGSYLVPKEATKLVSVTMVAELFCQCHRLRRETPTMHLKSLVRITYQCILQCEALKDQKRKVLLEKTKNVIQWIDVGLDCKKINIHKQASDELTRINQRFREAQGPGLDGAKLGGTQKRERAAKETKILDKANKSFEEHRAAFRMHLLNGLQVLLSSTNEIWTMVKSGPPD